MNMPCRLNPNNQFWSQDPIDANEITSIVGCASHSNASQVTGYTIPKELMKDIQTYIQLGCDGTLPNERELLQAVEKYAYPTSDLAPAELKDMSTLHDKERFMQGYRVGKETSERIEKKIDLLEIKYRYSHIDSIFHRSPSSK